MNHDDSMNELNVLRVQQGFQVGFTTRWMNQKQKLDCKNSHKKKTI